MKVSKKVTYLINRINELNRCKMSNYRKKICRNNRNLVFLRNKWKIIKNNEIHKIYNL